MPVNSPEYIEDKDCEIYHDPSITAIHVSPDENPVLKNCDCIAFVHYLKIDKKHNSEKNIVLFGGGYIEDLQSCSLTHQSLVEQAIESGIISEKTKIEGGGILDAQTFDLIKSSNLYGEPDSEVLDSFITLAQNSFHKDSDKYYLD